jgi:hypothetical protein
MVCERRKESRLVPVEPTSPLHLVSPRLGRWTVRNASALPSSRHVRRARQDMDRSVQTMVHSAAHWWCACLLHPTAQTMGWGPPPRSKAPPHISDPCQVGLHIRRAPRPAIARYPRPRPHYALSQGCTQARERVPRCIVHHFDRRPCAPAASLDPHPDPPLANAVHPLSAMLMQTDSTPQSRKHAPHLHRKWFWQTEREGGRRHADRGRNVVPSAFTDPIKLEQSYCSTHTSIRDMQDGKKKTDAVARRKRKHMMLSARVRVT